MSDGMEVKKGYTPPKEHFVYRVKFTKGEQVKFIGHLDIMRLFQRAIRRAELPVAYSNGFNPHQLLSFASPLTLGTTSIGEYGDFEMAKKIEPQKVMEQLNQVLPEGIQVTDSVLIREKTESAMAAIEAAAYEAVLDKQVTPRQIEEKLEGYLEQEEILVIKKTKKKEQEANIRPDIFELKNSSEDDIPKLSLFLAAGSERNLKPEPVIRSFYAYLGIPFFPYTIRYCRLELFRRQEDKLVSLCDGIGVRYLKEEALL